MLDARFNRTKIITYKPLKVIVSIITAVAFLFASIPPDVAWAARTPLELSSVSSDRAGSPGIFKELNVETFSLPEYLGQVKDRWNRPEPQTPDPEPHSIIIHIQDAHCNYAAQHSISKILDHLLRSYSIQVINLEGGAQGYDLSIFTRIPDKNIREKVADDFVKEGLVSGAEYYAINNPDKATLWGVEDTDLYVENLNIYRESLTYKDEVDKYIKNLSYILSNLKRHMYSQELLEFDSKYAQYKANNIEFKDYLTYAIDMAKKRMIDIRLYTNIYLLSQSLEQESKIDFKKANNERDYLIDKLQKILSKVELEELVLKTLEFKTDKISRDNFYGYIMKKVKEVGLSLDDYPEVNKYIVYVSLYGAIDKSKVMTELDELENKIKGSLYSNDGQKELNTLSKNLILTRNIFNVTLTKEDYKYYKDNEDSFDVERFAAFINKYGPIYKISAELDKTIHKLDDYRYNISNFYECSLKRDKAFLKNIRFAGDESRDQGPGPRVTILVTGGFHTENLTKLFKENGISYVSVMPNFKNNDEYDSQYFKLLAGEMSGVEKRLYSAIAAKSVTVQASLIAIAPPLSEPIALKVWGLTRLQYFRARVYLRELVLQGYRVKITDDKGEEAIYEDGKEGDLQKTMTLAELLKNAISPVATSIIPAPASAGGKWKMAGYSIVIDTSNPETKQANIEKAERELFNRLRSLADAGVLKFGFGLHRIHMSGSHLVIGNEDTEGCVFRLAEVIGNATEKGKATRVTLTLFIDGDNTILRVRDNGIGASRDRVSQFFDKPFKCVDVALSGRTLDINNILDGWDLDQADKEETPSTGIGLLISYGLSLDEMGIIKFDTMTEEGERTRLVIARSKQDKKDGAVGRKTLSEGNMATRGLMVDFVFEKVANRDVNLPPELRIGRGSTSGSPLFNELANGDVALATIIDNNVNREIESRTISDSMPQGFIILLPSELALKSDRGDFPQNGLFVRLEGGKRYITYTVYNKESGMDFIPFESLKNPDYKSVARASTSGMPIEALGVEAVNRAIDTAVSANKNLLNETDVIAINKSVEENILPADKRTPEIISSILKAIDNLSSPDISGHPEILAAAIRGILSSDAVRQMRKDPVSNPINVVVQFVPSIEFISPAAKNSPLVSGMLEREYGLNAKNIVGTPDQLRDMVDRAVSAMGDKIDSRAFIYLPVNMRGEYDKLKVDDARVRVQYIEEAGEFPDVMTHFILGIKLLDYDRLKEKGRAPENPQDILNLLAAVIDNPEGPKYILDNLFKITVKIKKINFKEIEDWKRAQDMVLKAL